MNQHHQHLSAIQPYYDIQPQQTVVTRIVVNPNYDANANPWVAYDAIGLWFKGLCKWPVRTLSVTIGLAWFSLFCLAFLWNALFVRQQIAATNPFNPIQSGYSVGGIVGVPVVDAARPIGNQVINASFGTSSRQMTSHELRQLQRGGGLQTVPVSDPE